MMVQYVNDNSDARNLEIANAWYVLRKRAKRTTNGRRVHEVSVKMTN